ncbi:Fibronectin type III domain-containing protein [Pricia antarctica]|uniref:Fibronectin type III domain-containing protein n=2 Tax=Pricia antarctica TaxID=641691 RepID=A0A1G7ABU7_9FLAO|nr:Fibronectin type III domain-containing protein [Pricia antarctica]
MKKYIYILFILLTTHSSFSQDNGMTYQAVIYQPGGEQLPGQDNVSAPMANTNICIKFSIIDLAGNIEYEEVATITTDAFGMVNLVIGSNNQTSGYVDGFDGVLWDNFDKYLKVGLDLAGSCLQFEEISNQRFNYVPLALNAKTAEMVTGIVPIENGGTGAETVGKAKINLELDNVDNTSDFDKPVSQATQGVLDVKENIDNKSLDIINDANSDVKYPSVKAIKTYIDTNASTGSSLLSAEVSRATNAESVIQSDVDANQTASESADATLQSNIDGLETNSNTAIAAVQADVDANEIASDAADATLTTSLAAEITDRIADVDTEEARALAAESVIQSDVDANQTASESADATLQSNIDGLETNSNTAIAAVQADVDTNETDSDAADVALQNNINTVQADVDANEADTDTAIAAVQADVDANELATQIAFDLKADIASPTFTGTPLAPTATAGTSTTQIATTAFVGDAVSTSTTGKFVDLTTDQSIDGLKVFSSDIRVNGLVIGKGNGGGDSNVAVGTNLGTGTGYRNTGVGTGALNSFSGTSFGNNTGVGYYNMLGLTTGYGNTSLGAETMFNVAGNNNNTGIGNQSLINVESSDNTAVGANSGSAVTTGAGNTFLGRAANISDGAFSNSTAIGKEALVTASNTIQLGNASVTGVQTSGAVTASGYKTISGTSTQFLKADGSVDVTNYASLESPTFTGTVTGITSTMVGLENVNNTSDADKPISTTTQIALNTKVDLLLSNLSNTATARANLGVAIGSNVQPYNANLDDLADGTLSASKVENAITTAGTSGEVWTSDGSGAGTWAVPANSVIQVGDGLVISGTGSAADPYDISLPPGGTTGQVLTIGAGGAPTWADASIGGTTAGEMQYWDGSAWVAITPGTEGQVLKFTNNVPAWGVVNSVPGIPTIGTATGGNGQATVTFTAPENSGGLEITGYTVTSNPGGITATGTDSPISVTGLTNGTSYTFTVTATNSMGTSAESSVSNSVIPVSVPNAPTIGEVTAGNELATVPFTAPSNNGGSTITSYTATSSPGNITKTISQSGSGTITVTGLTKGTSYTFTVTATNSMGTSAASNVSNFVTPVGVPNAPTIGNVTAGNEIATVPFTAPSNNGGSAITSYTATSSPGNITKTISQSGSGTITVTGLTNGTAYTFTVTATNAIGTSTVSANSNSVTPVLSIGDSAHGGIVFHIFGSGEPGYIEGETHGLVAASSDQSSSTSWGCNNGINGADGTAIGTGAQNTLDMVAAGCATSGKAAYVCTDLIIDGYDDWFLPSKGEMHRLITKIRIIGNITNTYYWTSSEYSNSNAWVVHYLGTSYNHFPKNDTYPSVRAIRAF